MFARVTAPVATELRLPRRIGRYTLFDRIGQGGMAEIFLARAATELGGSRLVVVKQILPQFAEVPDFERLLVAEAKLASRLTHANVTQVYDLGREDGCLFIAMQYVEGLDLNELLRRCAKSRTPMPIPFALHIVTEALRGLDYAHRRTADDGTPLGIVHRDVSPSNVLASFEGEVKVCDFGIARANDIAESLPDDALKGKAGYMSPEHARGEALDARADVFAAGILLWELLAGRRMYKAQPDGPSLLELARRGDVPPLEPRGLAHEAELHAIVGRALARDRDARYPSAQAMLRDLEAYVAKAGLVTSGIKLGDWMSAELGSEVVAQRRARERAAKALEAGPLAEVRPIGGAAYAKTPAPTAVAPAPPEGALAPPSVAGFVSDAPSGTGEPEAPLPALPVARAPWAGFAVAAALLAIAALWALLRPR